MKKSISVISSANFGVWNIPARGQGYINSHYANIYKYKIESIYQEPLLKKDFYLLHQKIKKENYNLIFCSIYQLPTNKSEKIIFIKNFKKFYLHFALEGIKGKGSSFIKSIFQMVERHNHKEDINIKNEKYFGDIFKFYRNKII